MLRRLNFLNNNFILRTNSLYKKPNCFYSSGSFGYLQQLDFIKDNENQPSLLEKYFTDWVKNNGVIQISVVNNILHSFIKIKDYKGAEKFFQKLKSFPSIHLDSFTYSIAIDIYCKQQHPLIALELIDEMETKNIKPNRVSYSPIISAFAEMGNTEKIIEILDTMKKKNIESDRVLYNSFMKAYSKQGNIKKVTEIFKEMKKQYHPDFTSYILLIQCYLKNRDIENAKKALDLYINEFKGNLHVDIFSHYLRGLRPLKLPNIIDYINDILQIMDENLLEWNALTFNTLIDLYSDIKNYSKVKELQEKMIKVNIAPNIYTYSSLLANYTSSNINDILQFISSMPESSVGVKTVTSAVVSSLNSMVKNDEIIPATQFFRDVQKLSQVQTTIEMYNILFAGYLKKKMFNKIEELYSTLQEDIDIYPDTVTFNILIKAQQYPILIEQIYQKMISSKVPQDVATLNALIFAYSNCRCTEKILPSFNLLKEKGIVPNTTSYNNALRGFIKNGDWENTINIINKIYNENIQLDAVTYSILINFVFKKTKIIVSFENINHKVFQHSANPLEIAKLLRQEALDKNIKDSRIFYPILSKYALAKNIVDLKKELNVMLSYNINYDLTVYNILISCYARMLDFKNIEDCFTQMKEKNIKPNTRTFNPILYHYCKEKDMIQAEKWFARVKSVCGCADKYSYNLMLSGYLSLNNEKRKTELKNEMVKLF